MLLKIIGSIFVIAASSFLGYFLAADYSKRPQQLRTLQVLFQMLENEICFMSNLLSDAFEKIARSNESELSELFSTAAENMRKEVMNACEAWEKAVRNSLKNISLNNEDGEILISFGKMLGSSDIEGQVKNIRLLISQLKLQEEKAEAARSKYEKMYKSLGVLGGLAIVIILL